MDGCLTWALEGHLTNARVPIITGPPGCGKTRLAEEAAKSFAREKPERFFARISLESAREHLRPFLPKTELESSYRLLAATLLFALFESFLPELYTFEWTNAEEFILGKLPSGVKIIALVIDEFSSDLPIAGRLFSGSMNALPAQTKLKVVPVFAGVHRTRVPTEMRNLLRIKQRTSGQANTSVFELPCLSRGTASKLVREMTSRWGVAFDDAIKPNALGSIFDACGGAPSLLVLTFMTVSEPEFTNVLKEITLNKAVGIDTGARLWRKLVSRLSDRFSVTKFAALVSESEASSGPVHASAAFHSMNRASRRSVLVATRVMERLVLMAMSGVSVELAGPVLRMSDLASFPPDDATSSSTSSSTSSFNSQALLSFTYQNAKSMVDIVPFGEDKNFGRVAIPLLAVATMCEFFHHPMKLERSLLDPFATTPTLLDNLAIVSLANICKANSLVGRSDISLDTIRPGSRRWGRDASLRIPELCEVVQLADHLGVNDQLPGARTQPNGKGIPVKLREGLFFKAAVNQPAVDGGGVFIEKSGNLMTIIVSQSKSAMDYVPQSGHDGEVVTIGKAEAARLLDDMRDVEQVTIRRKFCIKGWQFGAE